MRVLSADEARDCVTDLIHFETQRAPDGLDLTVGAVFGVTGPGALDFGGGEFEPASRSEVEPGLASPDDDYGWWELEPGGAYVIHYNEGVDLGAGQSATVHPLSRLQQAGASHGAFVAHGTRDSLGTLLQVGPGGCRIKENARVSRLRVTEAA